MHKNRRRLTIALSVSALIAFCLVVLPPRIATLSPSDSVSDSNPVDDAPIAANPLGAAENDLQAGTVSIDLTASSFLRDAAQLSRFQLLAAEIAMGRASDSEVIALAERIATDHKRIGDNLTNRAAAAGFDTPQRIAVKHRTQLSRLRRTGDATFDRFYVLNAMENHQALLSLFRAASSAPTLDPPLSIYAKDTLHVLNAHEREMQSLLQYTR